MPPPAPLLPKREKSSAKESPKPVMPKKSPTKPIVTKKAGLYILVIFFTKIEKL